MNKLVAIVGPTASGKSALGMRVAQDFGGEIICADSRTIYKDMNIGTAKPSATDQTAVPHHLLDIVDPDQSYSAAEFKTAALDVINQIRGRDKLPVMVGGSGLYAYSVLYDYQFPAGARSEVRLELESKPLSQLVERLQELDPELAASIDLKNARRVIRAIETAGQERTQSHLMPGTILIGLRPDVDTLERNISDRTRQMIKAGLQKETAAIIKQFGSDLEVLHSPGYQEMLDHIADTIDLAKTAELINLHTKQLAKRQLAWFKRNPDIHWFENGEAAYQYIAGQLRL